MNCFQYRDYNSRVGMDKMRTAWIIQATKTTCNWMDLLHWNPWICISKYFIRFYMVTLLIKFYIIAFTYLYMQVSDASFGNIKIIQPIRPPLEWGSQPEESLHKASRVVEVHFCGRPLLVRWYLNVGKVIHLVIISSTQNKGLMVDLL